MSTTMRTVRLYSNVCEIFLLVVGSLVCGFSFGVEYGCLYFTTLGLLAPTQYRYVVHYKPDDDWQ